MVCLERNPDLQGGGNTQSSEDMMQEEHGAAEADVIGRQPHLADRGLEDQAELVCHICNYGSLPRTLYILFIQKTTIMPNMAELML